MKNSPLGNRLLCGRSPRLCRRALMLLFLLSGFSFQEANAITKNGFDLANGLVPAEEILSGGPPRDGIPAIDLPHFTSAGDADFLHPDDRVLAIEMEGVSRAYPIRILNWHEIVNDRIGKHHFVVTYCPLCGTGAAFEAEIGGQAYSFGVSGLLYNSDVLLYDRVTDSLWSQVLGKAITGPLQGTSLKLLPLEHTTWKDWRKRHPDTQVLSTNTGFVRDYQRNPYAGYERSRHIYFSVSRTAPPNYHPKERVLGLNAGGIFKAYPFIELNKQGQARIKDEVNAKRYLIHWSREHQSGRIFDAEGNEVPVITGFWFAWFAFHPDTLVFKALPAAP